MMNLKVKHGKFSKKKISFAGFFMEILKKKNVFLNTLVHFFH